TVTSTIGAWALFFPNNHTMLSMQKLIYIYINNAWLTVSLTLLTAVAVPWGWHFAMRRALQADELNAMIRATSTPSDSGKTKPE
ncbi:MAG: hypothetical protein WBA28_07660, partial [Microbacteriaceae bacterium]